MSVGILTAAVSVLAVSEISAAVVPLGTPAMGIKVEAGVYTVGGKTVTVRDSVGLYIDLPERHLVAGERIELSRERPAAWHKGTVLKDTLGTVDRNTRVPNIIDPDSVVIRSAGEPARVYVEGKDYVLDRVWGGLCRTDTGAVPDAETVLADYAVFRQRIDLVQVSDEGVATVKKGCSAVVCPEPPQPDPGSTAIARIYVPFRTKAVSDENIYPLPSDDVTWKSFVKVFGRDCVRRSRELLREGRPITIVCWGDSVTQGGSASAPEKRYVDLLGSRLRLLCPQSDIRVINAGVGGSNSDSRRSGFDIEVLAHKPDLITVEFVNDCGFTPGKIMANYSEFITRTREKLPDVEFVIITPHFVMPSMMGGYHAAVAAMQQSAEANGAAVADAANIWANLHRVGIPYATLLANEINHPNDLGHEFFVECLIELLEP